MRHKKTSGGFTLVELMVVVAIIAVVSAVAMSSLKGDPVPDATRSVTRLLNEARRRAISGGAVRPAVAANIGTRARTRVEIENTLAPELSYVRLWEVVEDPEPAITANWVLMSQLALADVKIYAVGAVAESLPEATMPAYLAVGAPEQRNYLPDGTSEAMTIYLGKRASLNSGKLYRIFVFPLSAMATAQIAW